VFTRANTICVYLKEYVKSEELWRREALGNRTARKELFFLNSNFFSNRPTSFSGKAGKGKEKSPRFARLRGCRVGKKIE